MPFAIPSGVGCSLCDQLTLDEIPKGTGGRSIRQPVVVVAVVAFDAVVVVLISVPTAVTNPTTL